MKRVAKFQEGGRASSGISNDPVGQNFRRLLERMTAPSARSEAPAQGPRPQSGQRPQEDRARMAAEAAAEFDREEAALAERARQRRNRPSAITNQPVGERLAGRAATPAPAPAPAMPAPTADYEERMRRGSLPAGRSAAPGPMGDYSERAAAGAAARPRPAQRQAPRSRMSEADRLNQMELDRIEQDRIDEARRGLREDADRRANRGFFERLGLRRTNETGMEPGTVEQRRNYLGSGAADTNVSYNKKGGLLKAKAPMKKGGAVKKAPAKMMKSGGKVAPKKMMKGGMTSKPKKMMGGGRAMYAKGGMAKGCK